MQNRVFLDQFHVFISFLFIQVCSAKSTRLFTMAGGIPINGVMIMIGVDFCGELRHVPPSN